LEKELASIGDRGRIGLEGRRPLFVPAARQAGKTLVVQDLPDGSAAQGSLILLESALDVVDGEVLFSHGEDKLADGVFLGLGARARLEITEELRLGAAEMMG
jgi:hypothetical protein